MSDSVENMVDVLLVLETRCQQTFSRKVQIANSFGSVEHTIQSVSTTQICYYSAKGVIEIAWLCPNTTLFTETGRSWIWSMAIVGQPVLKAVKQLQCHVEWAGYWKHRMLWAHNMAGLLHSLWEGQ